MELRHSIRAERLIGSHESQTLAARLRYENAIERISMVQRKFGRLKRMFDRYVERTDRLQSKLPFDIRLRRVR